MSARPDNAVQTSHPASSRGRGANQANHRTAMSRAHDAYSDAPAGTRSERLVEIAVEAYLNELQLLRRGLELRPTELWPRIPDRVRAIIREVAEANDMRVEWVLGEFPKGMRYACAACRHEIWRRLRAANPRPSYPLIGYWFGVDHTTVMAGCGALKRRSRRVYDLARREKAKAAALEAARDEPGL